MASTVLTRLAYCLCGRHLPPIVPLSKSVGPPAPQTSLSTISCTGSLNRVLTHPTPIFAVFQLPDELILSILSHISPDPQFTRYYTRFRILYSTENNNKHQRRMRFLRRLSMTCRTMWLRLLPWIWERLECIRLTPIWRSEGRYPRKLSVIMNVLRADAFLATSVRYF